MHDTRSCNACIFGPPNVEEVIRRIDEAVDVWGANFLRLDLESDGSEDGRIHWKTAATDPNYLSDVVEIVDHIGKKDGVYVLVSMWIDPSFSALGWPTADTIESWQLVAETSANHSHMLFGLVNEPQNNFNGAQPSPAQPSPAQPSPAQPSPAQPSAVWEMMNATVAAIREVESDLGSHNHIIAVQGTRGWARVLDDYVANVVYETHVYNPMSDFSSLVEEPAATLPVIVGEFGPVSGSAEMTLSDCTALMDLAETLEIPHLAWTFHMRCGPDLLVDNSGGGCGVDMELVPTSEWGALIFDRFSSPW